MKEHVLNGLKIIDLAEKNLSNETFFKMAKEIILKKSGSHFDPYLVEVFMRKEKSFM